MKNHKISIIDYGMGNLFSIASACKRVGLDPIITRSNSKIKDSSAIILPGVGAFNEAMIRLEKLNLINVIHEFVNSGKELFGICLGMQLLFSNSSEFGNTSGLDIIKGKVKRLDNLCGKSSTKIPYIGWNKIFKKKIDWKQSNFNGIAEASNMYFVHSYFVDPYEKKNIITESYIENKNFCSAIMYENIFATQFHPEKSGKSGLIIYSNFKNRL